MKLNLFSTFLVLGMLTGGCGQSKTVTITLIPSVGMDQRPFHSLVDEFFGMERSMVSISHCLQTHLATVVVKAINNNDRPDEYHTYPLVMDTEMASGPFDANWFSLYTRFLKPIQITVNRGEPINVGIAGAFFHGSSNGAPIDSYPADGICDDRTNAGVGIDSHALFGHTQDGFIANTELKVPLNLFVFDATPTTTPSPLPTYDGYGNVQPNAPCTSYPNAFCCINPYVFNSCPVREIVDLYTTDPSVVWITKVEYGFSANGGPHMVQLVPKTGHSHFYVPDVFPMRVGVDGSSGPQDMFFKDLDSIGYQAQSVKLQRVGQ